MHLLLFQQHVLVTIYFEWLWGLLLIEQKTSVALIFVVFFDKR